jgi:thiol-disulfide isomerase/thioredoxin
MGNIIKILLIISVGMNGYFIWDGIQMNNYKLQTESMNRAFGGEINKTSWSDGFELFVTKLKKDHLNIANRKYYYVNVWTSWCAPCINEMPWLDSIAGTLRKDVGYIIVSDLSNEHSNNCISKKQYNFKNFVFLNDMDDFISAICNQNRINTKVYPMVLILNNKGKILHYFVGAYNNAKEASEFAKLINKL